MCLSVLRRTRPRRYQRSPFSSFRYSKEGPYRRERVPEAGSRCIDLRAHGFCGCFCCFVLPPMQQVLVTWMSCFCLSMVPRRRFGVVLIQTLLMQRWVRRGWSLAPSTAPQRHQTGIAVSASLPATRNTPVDVLDVTQHPGSHWKPLHLPTAEFNTSLLPDVFLTSTQLPSTRREE